MTFDEADYRAFFARLSGKEPFDYQVEVARLLAEGENVVLRAPTGAGKTWATLAPFLYLRDRGGPCRVLYALPLRTLAQSIYREARRRMRSIGLSPKLVRMQTGEQPDDEFLQQGTVIVTTYDQVLSGLLHRPYGLSDRLHNINAAAIAGTLVVFDEFHLMEPQRAFLTAVAGLHLFRGLCQSVWMTATATTPLEAEITTALSARLVPGDADAQKALHEALPSVTTVRRQWQRAEAALTADAVLAAHRQRSIVIVNTVARAQAIYKAIDDACPKAERTFELIMLHARFFRRDRQSKERRLQRLFGEKSNASAILIATQVVEAGIDISCEDLHTELCPMSSLIQRAGRCARYPEQTGTVHIYDLPDEEQSWLPYGTLQAAESSLALTDQCLRDAGRPDAQDQILDPATAAAWVEAVHRDADAHAVRQIEGWHGRQQEVLRRVDDNVSGPKVGISDLIREQSLDQVAVVVAMEGNLPDKPGQRESVSISRWSVRAAALGALAAGQQAGWIYDWQAEAPWRKIATEGDIKTGYVFCLPPSIARYDPNSGLHLSEAGTECSPVRALPLRPGYAPLHREPWTLHARLVAEEASHRLVGEGGRDGALARGLRDRYALTPAAIADAVRATALLHDLGKLRSSWQEWAAMVQADRDPAYQHTESLAHTDYDAKNLVDRERERRFYSKRPAHAAAGAFYGLVALQKLLPNVPDESRGIVLAACAAAILGHHGSWLPSDGAGIDMEIADGLAQDWHESVAAATEVTPDQRSMGYCVAMKDKRKALKEVVHTISPNGAHREWWPLVAYLTRTLRLSDQRATAEGSGAQ